MTWEKYQFLWEYGSTEDKIILILKVIAGIIMFASIFAIAINSTKIRKALERLENEQKITNRHLAHLDPNKYNESNDDEIL